MKKKLFLLILLSTLFASNNALAKVSGPCASCHTMHNSQDGSNVIGNNDNDTSRSLTKGDCIGCHTGTNGSFNVGDAGASTMGNIPYITDTSVSVADYGSISPGATLAGGSFYFVKDDSAMGHNVKGLNGIGVESSDTNILTDIPPGWVDGWGDSGIADETEANWSSNQLTCAGTYGCHGSHSDADDFVDIRGAHHGDDSGIDGTTTVKSFRFLKGIIGYEDPDWEYSRSSSDHNQYFGAAHITKEDVLNAQDAALGSGEGRGISFFCGTCHGNFHSGTSGDLNVYGTADDTGEIGMAPWLRHPTDYALHTAIASIQPAEGDAVASEYSAYSTYSVIAPVATSAHASGIVTSSEIVSTNVVASATTSIVNCLSCHRAHGSPYADLLRWDYSTMIAGSGAAGTGCFICHSTKN